jgi:hypothetical protein
MRASRVARLKHGSSPGLCLDHHASGSNPFKSNDTSRRPALGAAFPSMIRFQLFPGLPFLMTVSYFQEMARVVQNAGWV